MKFNPWPKAALVLFVWACGTPKSDETGLFADGGTRNPNDEALDSVDQEAPPSDEGGAEQVDTADVQTGGGQQPESGDDEPPGTADSGAGWADGEGIEDPNAESGSSVEDTESPTEDPESPTEDGETPDADLDGSATVVRGTALPAPLPPRGTSGTLIARSEAAPSGTVTSVDVLISLEHTCTKDLTATLTSPSGTDVVIFDFTSRPVCSSDMEDTQLSDEATTPIASGATPFVGPHKPAEPLSAFIGEDAAGPWVLTIIDDTVGDSGSVQSWSLNIHLD